MLDHAYRQTATGARVPDFLAYLKLERKAASTIDQYERAIAVGCLLYPDLAFADWEAEHLISVLGVCPGYASQKKMRSAWASFLRWGYLNREIPSNPIERVPSPKQDEQRHIETFTPAEVEALVGLPLIDGALFTVLFDAGLRLGEARRLRLFDCKLDRGHIAVLNGKGGKDRVIPIPARTVSRIAQLATIEGLNETDHLWYTKRGNRHGSAVRRAKPITVGTAYPWYARCLDAAGVAYVPRNDRLGIEGIHNPHVTRHTYAVRWLRGLVGRTPAEGAGEFGRMGTLQRALGHKSIQTTIDLYGHLDVSDIEADLVAMGVR